MQRRVTVFIPLVSPPAGHAAPTAQSAPTAARLIEVYAESVHWIGDDKNSLQQRTQDELKAVSKYWDTVAAPLRRNSPALYQSGCVAANAVRKIHFKRRFFAFFQRVKPNAGVDSQRLYAVQAWGPTEGRSAELGLALALAAAVCGTNRMLVIATGALSADDANARQANLFKSDDVKVHSVGGVVEKLSLILFELEDGIFRELAGQREIVVITPKFFRTGLDVAWQPVEALAEVSALRALGVAVYPVDWLSEALSRLQADTAEYLFFDRLALWGMALILGAVMVFGAINAWREADIPMAFIPVDSESAAEPVQLCSYQQRHYALPLAKTQWVPTVQVSGVIAWRVAIGQQDGFDAALAKWLGFRGYYVALIVVSEHSPATFDYAKADGTTRPLIIPPGHSYEGWIKLNETAETNALLLLARRYAPFDPHTLRERFKQWSQASAQADASFDVTAAVAMLKTLAPGSLVFPFVSVNEPSICTR